MNVSSWSIRHPVPAILLFALLTLLGLGAFHKLRIQNFPDIELPVITVRAALEGAAPTQLETEVARKIEDSVASLGGIENIRSTLTDGVAVVAVEFNIDKDPEVALNEVRNAVDSVRADLPQEMNPPVISKVTTSGRPILTFTIAAPSMDPVDLSWFVDNDVAKAMLSVRGVGRLARHARRQAAGALAGIGRAGLSGGWLSGLGLSRQHLCVRPADRARTPARTSGAADAVFPGAGIAEEFVRRQARHAERTEPGAGRHWRTGGCQC